MLTQVVHAAERVPGWWKLRPLIMPHLAALHRRRLGKVTFVAITGSAGKTTANLLTHAILATAGRIQGHRQANRSVYVMAAVIATKPSDDFCVIELGAERPGNFDSYLAAVQPRIGVVTAVGTDHLKAFNSVEAITEEKAKFIACLPENGTAVLNADDPRVMAMAHV